ncbi:MAG: holin-like protein [Gammaproteobacteria bacterium]|jgi:holin-like protein
MLKPLLTLIGAQLAGEFVVSLFGIRFPAPIMGMLILFAVLCALQGVPAQLESLSGKLFPYIPLLLIPISVGVLQYRQQLDGSVLAIGAAIVLSTSLGVASCGVLLKWLLKR